MKERHRNGAARFAAALTGLLVVAAVPVALAADGPSLRAQASGLQEQAASLDARAHAATLQLYALQSTLARARSDLATISARREQAAAERAATRRQISVARAVQKISESRLGDLVRALYESPDHDDPLAVILGAASLEEALTSLDNLDRAATETTRIVAQAREARLRLAKLDRRLAAKESELASLEDAAKSRAGALAAAVAERSGFIASLRRQRGLTAARIASIESQARAAETHSRTVVTASSPVSASTYAAPEPTVASQASPAGEPAAAPAPAPAPAAASGPRTLTVESTGYALRGRTASGLPTGPGIVAVDPSVIPLGTRLSIPGYGTGVAADTGGAVHGNVIDLWFPSTADALAWGRRTVTITILG